jgi:hypothetical protein
MRRTELCLLGLLIIGISPAAHADWRVEGETGFIYESNLSNSNRSADMQDDWAWRNEVRLANGLQLARDWRLIVAADCGSTLWAEFDGFDEVGAGLAATLRYRFGLGAQAPWISLGERIGYDSFREESRSGWDESLRLRAGVSVSSRLALEAGYTFENMAATGDFFDLQSHRADVRAIFDLTSSLQIGVGYAFRSGDVISYAVPPRPDIFQIATVRPGVTTFGSNPAYNAYRLSGQTHSISAFTAYNLTRYLTFQLSYEYSQTSHDPLHYENHVVEGKIAFAY